MQKTNRKHVTLVIITLLECIIIHDNNSLLAGKKGIKMICAEATKEEENTKCHKTG